ncbi:hypothetical protein BHE74_00037680 [Ensete ventricosum]|nr:hypothetical protein GW17_00061886 [Ensete ventricosum]RWW55665.1 hypothetical protein BHE74_00037680 [Ensete ventricosum]RZS10266.1 hypothetical protein BHM03_00041457 [Ensete ventricosum]
MNLASRTDRARTMRGLGDTTGNRCREGAALGGQGVSRLRSTISVEDPRDGSHIGGRRRYRRRRHRCSHGFTGQERSGEGRAESGFWGGVGGGRIKVVGLG